MVNKHSEKSFTEKKLFQMDFGFGFDSLKRLDQDPDSTLCKDWIRIRLFVKTGSGSGFDCLKDWIKIRIRISEETGSRSGFDSL